MTEYPAGTVAVATVRGVPNVRVMRMAQVHDRHVYLWVAAEVADEASTFRDRDVTDVRPLVVLDPEALITDDEAGNTPKAVDLARCLRFLGKAEPGTYRGRVARRVADAIESPVKPPRIPEPGLWGVVEALTSPDGSTVYFNERVHLSRHPDGWRCDRGAYKWSDLIDPTLVRPGIEDAS